MSAGEKLRMALKADYQSRGRGNADLKKWTLLDPLTVGLVSVRRLYVAPAAWTELDDMKGRHDQAVRKASHATGGMSNRRPTSASVYTRRRQNCLRQLTSQQAEDQRQ